MSEIQLEWLKKCKGRFYLPFLKSKKEDNLWIFHIIAQIAVSAVLVILECIKKDATFLLQKISQRKSLLI